MVEEEISPEERASLSARLLLLAPPCEFNEVLEDVKTVSGCDQNVQKKLAAATAQYNRDQMITVRLPGSEHNSLLSVHGDLDGGYFLCPRMHVSFYYDHLKQCVGDVTELKPNDAEGGDIQAEPWRFALESAATEYCLEHFPGGTVAVYAPVARSNGRQLIMCMESHFSKHQSTGRWRSEWTVRMPDDLKGGIFPVHGVLKVQTHMYEEGNVQLISSKEVDFTLSASNAEELAKNCIRQIKEADCAYQIAVGENFKTMSDTTFKALRRQLPLTRSKIDWNKIITYQVGSELTRAT
ncbi:unnamed protein product [Calicophoron daubneyi]|uniref:F-actin-capping protein subunit alpha n=1 Tax=Calicophoron daubneyi TaxID=300641 RepID=A0AAV2T9K9_CALDB